MYPKPPTPRSSAWTYYLVFKEYTKRSPMVSNALGRENTLRHQLMGILPQSDQLWNSLQGLS